ncbi:MAG: RNA polymerase sigma factor [Pseudonocardia sp.]|nr:RNA polymerase sigma factor [Pseudonocardia sp.]
MTPRAGGDGGRELEDVLRELTPAVLGAVLRRYGDFDRTEDAVQEALLAAARQWPVEGAPTNPRGWLVAVATRRLTDQWRVESARRRREETASALEPPGHSAAPGVDELEPAGDDTLELLFLCCHSALSEASQVALTLRAVGGLTTGQIAAAFLVPEATMTRRISRAKRSIEAAGARFGPIPVGERTERLASVLHTLYLIYNEGYTATRGDQLYRAELTGEAIRLVRQVLRLLPEDGEVAGLLALMLLTEARRPARTTADGGLVPLAEQDRRLWDSTLRDEGIALITATLPRSAVGPYQLQAAIAAVHAEARRAEDTDWPQIVALYRLLARTAPSPMVTLSQATAVAMVDGPAAGLELLAPLEEDDRIAKHHRLAAVRAHLLELAGDRSGAADAYRLAARRTTSRPEQRYLEARAACVDK